MSYQLIGNIAALICDDGIEPLATATFSVYLPALCAAHCATDLGIFREPVPISAAEAARKEDRLLARATLDADGNFRANWQEIHLFTEPLELDVCITSVPGARKTGGSPQHFSLGLFVPHWRRNKDRYVAAFAYMVPSGCWAGIRHQLQAWAITGVVRHYRSRQPVPKVIVQAFHARNGKKLGEAFANAQGRFCLRFAFEPLHRHLLPMGNGELRIGPDVFFRILTQEGFLLWSEDRAAGFLPERQGLPVCSKQDIDVKPSPALKSRLPLSGWRQLVQAARLRRKYSGHHSLV